MAESRICSIDGCDKPVQGRGWCAKHYMRWYKHGDASVKLTNHGEPAKFLDRIVSAPCADECINWPFSRNAKGYGRHRVNGRRVAAHKVVCEMVNGPQPTKDHVCAHSCGKGHLGCVNPRHLRWATHKENHADRIKHGTSPRGENNGNAKMTEATVRKVKAMLGKATQHQIAEALGVSRSAVRDIKVGKSWSWL